MVSEQLLAEVKAAIGKALVAKSYSEQLANLWNLPRLRLVDDTINSIDPFSSDYRHRMLNLYKSISDRPDYQPEEQEKIDILDQVDVSACPIPYRFQNSGLVGEFLACYGWILKCLNVTAGAKVLEYGAGEGQLIIQLARMGCEAYAIDLEARMLKAIDKQCDAINLRVHTKRGRFGETFEGIKFDRIIFFEAFHHCLDHRDALLNIRPTLKRDGFICFSGEPIIKRGSPNKECVPYAWGLRLDAESVRSTNEFGWMELGYSEEYFVDLLLRTGYTVEFIPCPFFERGHVYIARPVWGEFPILNPNILLTNWAGASGWHGAETTHRWTDGEAILPLAHVGFTQIRVKLINWHPKSVTVVVQAGDATSEVTIDSRGEATLDLPITSSADYLTIRSPTRREYILSGRRLGIAVSSIHYL